jgi:tRNA pseudouridine32 synthase/23S rRNA pseudouridine746 synthase
VRTPEDGPLRLLDLLKEKLPHIAADSWPERFDFGGVYVNGLEALGDRDLPLPVRVEYYEPKFEISGASSIFPPFKEEFVLFSDGDIAVVYKPPHLSSMPAKEQRHFSLKASLDSHFKTTIHMPSRLDVSAQGIVVVSLSTSAHAGLQRAFETRTVHKTYRLATTSPCQWNDKTVELNIALQPQHPVLRTVSVTAGQTARTHFRLSHRRTDGSIDMNVFEAKPITGRTHQIRVHSAASGIPILGDNFYGGSSAPYLHLVSCAITFPHPVSREEMTFTLPEHLRPTWT